MTLAQKQDHFQRLYSQLFDKLYRYSYTRVPNITEAEDIVADIFLSAYRSLDKFDDAKGNLEQWLIGIARYAIIDYWKARKITLEFDEAILLFDALEQDNSLEKTIDNKMLFAKIMDQLPGDVAALLTLRYVDDLTYEEIAKLTGKTAESIRQFFSRLHKKLRLQFSDYTQEYAYV